MNGSKLLHVSARLIGPSAHFKEHVILQTEKIKVIGQTKTEGTPEVGSLAESGNLCTHQQESGCQQKQFSVRVQI